MNIGRRYYRKSALILCCLAISIHARAEQHAKLQPVPFTAVQINDEFWAPRLRTLINTTLPHSIKMCEQTGRLRNFDKAAGKLEGDFQGYFFNDSDVYKVLEGAAYALQLERDPKLEAAVDDIITRIAAAQQDDGYLNTYFTLKKDEKRWTNIRVRHELYCAGHLLEAGIAYFQATGKRSLLDVATKLIHHIETVFGPGKKHDPPGHQEIEIALVRLFHITGEQRYLELAKFFLDQRGHATGRELYGEYSQDHLPLCEQTQIVGHAVRAMYMLCAAADVAAINGEQTYIDANDRIWRDTVNTKMYITGGIGPSSHNEGFTASYDLPNDTAYAETCASIGMVLWNHRLNLLHADARYVDVLERALYNGLLSGISLSGDKFFYTNPLGSRGNHARKPWYSCACCPTNIVRFLPTVGGYMYVRSDDAIYVNLYIGSQARIALDNNVTVGVKQQTRYPWDGKVTLTIDVPKPSAFDLYLRIPGWSHGASLSVAGRPAPELDMQRGYVRIRRSWRPGDKVELRLPMPVERVVADPRVKANVGRVALQRGPLVYCLEGVDNDMRARNLALPCQSRLTVEHRSDLLGGVTVVRGTALAVEDASQGWKRELYRRAAQTKPIEFTAVPYYAWQNRGPTEMLVWIPESPALVGPLPVSWVKASSSHCYQRDTERAMHDRMEPMDSQDANIPRFTWWSRRGTQEWVQYDFDQPHTVSSVEVYWFDDSRLNGGCRPPASWKLLYRDESEWHEVNGASAYGTQRDQYNRVTFDPVKTDGLRIEVQLAEDYSSGVLEWKIFDE